MLCDSCQAGVNMGQIFLPGGKVALNFVGVEFEGT